LQILHPPKTSRDWDKSDPTQSTAIDALSASVLSGLFPSRKNLLRGKKTLAVERNVTRYTLLRFGKSIEDSETVPAVEHKPGILQIGEMP